MQAFVTGATGFLGRRIVRRLVERGDTVLALARESSDTGYLEGLGAQIVKGDLADVDAFVDQVSGCDVVFHAGARVATHGDWEEFFVANVEATQKLIDAASAAGARFVHVSSLGIFEIDRAGIVVTEETDYDHNPMLRGFYTRSKIDADRVACAAARTGKDVVVVRPGRLNGFDHPQGEPVFLGRVKKFFGADTLVVVSTPGYHVPTVHVENAADAVVSAGLTADVGGEIFNVIDDPEMTQREYFRRLSEARGTKLRVLFIPVALFTPAVKAVDMLHRLVKRRPWTIAYQLLRSELDARYPTDRAQEKLGWKPALEVTEGLRVSIAPDA
ncbi:MAG: nucleoside-diphosphate-sugar epimerase [Hyphomicrobiaceae bacterium]|jgi:nucleoside-diphosphate-sugar epimerase